MDRPVKARKGKGIWFVLAIVLLALAALVLTLNRPAKPDSPTINLPKIATLLPNSTVQFEETRLTKHYKRRWDEYWYYEYRAVYLTNAPIAEVKQRLESSLDKKQWKPVKHEIDHDPAPVMPFSLTWTESFKGRQIESNPKSAWTKSWNAVVTLLPGKKAFNPGGELPIEGRSIEIVDNGDKNLTTVGVVITYNMSKFTPPPPWKMAINATLRKIGLPSIP